MKSGPENNRYNPKKGLIMIDFRKLIDAAVHFGHDTARWCPKMEPYIWGQRNNVHLIDVSKTAFQLEKAAKFLENIATGNKSILFVGTKKAAQDIVKGFSIELGCPYVTHRWIGGTLTNNSQVKKSITKLLHYEDVLSKTDQSLYTKKELMQFQKLVNKLKENVGGIREFTWPVGAIVIVDIKKEQAALKEAATMGIPVVALVDTNCDPSLVDYVIPANDDAPRSIKVVLEYLVEAIKEGKKKAIEKPKEAAKLAEAQEVSELLLDGEIEEAVEVDKPLSKAKKAKDGKRSDVGRKPDSKRK